MSKVQYLNAGAAFSDALPLDAQENLFRMVLRDNFRPGIDVGLAAGMARRPPTSSPMELEPTWVRDAMGHSTPVNLERQKVVQDLIARGAPAEHVESKGAVTPLMWASGQNDVDMMEILLLAGADMYRKDYDQRDAFDHALAGDLLDALAKLVAHGYVPNLAQKDLAQEISPPEVVALLTAASSPRAAPTRSPGL